MKKIYASIFAICLLTLLDFSGAAQSVKAKASSAHSKERGAKIKQIETYSKQIADFVEKEKAPHLIVADISDFEQREKAVWKKFATEAEFEKAREKGVESYTTAYIWKKNDKPVRVNFTYSSPSGDWAEYFFQTFRADGSIAKAVRELRTFMGDVIVNESFIYDETGRILKKTKTFRDLNTNKIIKPTENFQNVEAGEIYMNTNKLPFLSILQ